MALDEGRTATRTVFGGASSERGFVRALALPRAFSDVGSR